MNAEAALQLALVGMGFYLGWIMHEAWEKVRRARARRKELQEHEQG